MLYSDSFQKAYANYQKGEAATSIEEREDFFNQALTLYTEDSVEDGKLYFNIANCYYQLNEMGMAIWYYYKALEQLPRDVKIKENFLKAQKEAGVSISGAEKIIKQLFFVHYYLSHSEKALALIGFSILGFVLGSYFIWVRKTFLKHLSLVILFICGIFVGSLYFESQSAKEGVFIQHSLLRCDAGMQYKEVDQRLVRAGERFKVLEIVKEGQWLRVKTQAGKKGFVLSDHVRFF